MAGAGLFSSLAMPRPRKPVSEWTRKRDLMARRKGYASYYDYRLHGSGRIPAGQPPLLDRSAARGHRGPADLLRKLHPGDALIVPDGLAAVEKDSRGRFVLVEKLVIDGRTGKQQLYRIRNYTERQMVDLIHAEHARGAQWSPSPSLDQRRLVPVSDRPPPVVKAAANRALAKASLPRLGRKWVQPQ